MVFVAFMQHCIQWIRFHVGDVGGTVLYSVYSGPSPLQGEGYLFEPSTLWV